MLGFNASIRKWVQIFFSIMAICLMLVAMPFAKAHANAQQCSSLKRQLASLGRSNNYAKYDVAAEQQSTEIWYIKRDIRRAGCRYSNSGQCRQLNSTLRKMNANYKALIRKRESYRGTSSSRARAIKNKMSALGCSGSSNRRKIVNLNPGNHNEQAAVPSSRSGGNYRTMCVRTCDGYYFPVSHVSSTKDFKRDEAICNALCPATEVRLFVYKNSGEAEEMATLEGEAYTALPTAFIYRTQPRSPSCSCGTPNPAAAGLAIEREVVANETDMSSLDRLPFPVKRPDMFADPESRKNAATA